jgi:DNA transposition AAA+ family ATPase
MQDLSGVSEAAESAENATSQAHDSRIWKKPVSDPTTLILVDEADRLQMNSLEQMRSIFDEGTAGMVLIGMPGIENRIARFPQFLFAYWFRP